MLAGRRRWRGAVSDAGRLPLVGPVVTGAYRRYFNAATARTTRLFQGVFPDFAAAEAAFPPGRNRGYDNAESAGRNVDEWLRVYPSDYPVMFWLSKLLGNCTSLFDWGGNVGLKYFTFQKYLTYPENFTWIVEDVPAVVELGRASAGDVSSRELRFTSQLDDLPGADILLAAGSLHFIADPFEQLRALPQLPEHFILSKVPAHDGPSVWTLNNMGTAMCPYRLFNRDELLQTIESLGYRLVDDWHSPDGRCEIPFFPEYTIDAYAGFYFVKP